MKSKPKYYSLFFLFVLRFASFSQNGNADSLKTLLNTLGQDSGRVKALNELAKCFGQGGNFEEGFKYGAEAMKLSEKLNYYKGIVGSGIILGNIYILTGRNNEALKLFQRVLKITHERHDKKGEATAYNNIAKIYINLRDYSSALKNSINSLSIRKETNDAPELLFSYKNVALLYTEMGNYPEALKINLNGLALSEKIKDELSTALFYGLVGDIYCRQNNFDDALKFQFKALEIRKKLENADGLSACYISLGNIYYRQRDFDKSLSAHTLALDIQKKAGIKSALGACFGNIGGVYCELKNYKESLKNHFASLEMYRAIGDRQGEGVAHICLGTVNLCIKKYAEAEKYLKEGLKISIETSSAEYIKSAYENLSELYIETGNFKQALENYKLSIVFRDSLINSENTKKTVQAQMNYEFDKKEQATKLDQENKDAIANEEKEKQKILRNSFIGGFVFVLLLALLIFKGYRNKQKANFIITKQKDEVEQSKKIIEFQKLEVELKQKEILDSIYYAKRIQTALITNENYIGKCLNRLSGA